MKKINIVIGVVILLFIVGIVYISQIEKIKEPGTVYQLDSKTRCDINNENIAKTQYTQVTIKVKEEGCPESWEKVFFLDEWQENNTNFICCGLPK